MILPVVPKRKDVRASRFPFHIFWLVLGILLLTTGIHIGLIVLMQKEQIVEWLQTHIMLAYWFAVSSLLTLILQRKFKKTYDEPTQKISEAMDRISHGDFSVRLTPTHSGKKMDYLDYMMLDLNQMAEELSSIETLKTDFISNVSHEFKTPLSLLNNYATLLKSSVPQDDICQEYASVIADSAARMSELVSNILRLNKLEQHALSAQKAPFDLSRQICECVIMFENKWEEKNIEINMEVEDRCVIRSEESLLEMVWNNLISNAVKFTPVGGSITVTERRTQDQVIVTVTDTGCGISAESLPHIFDKFYQADRSHATEGNGLGLALVQQVLRLLGGSITAESEENFGSTFTVTLPLE